ncbi:MAG: hypothetical protein QXE81_01725 [Desulfurococcaceae archaeon]
MSTAEIEMKINECITELSRFTKFSPQVKQAIEGLEKLKEEIKNLNRQKAEEIIKIIEEYQKRSTPYAFFIPKTIENLKYIKQWLEEKKEELPM